MRWLYRDGIEISFFVLAIGSDWKNVNYGGIGNDRSNMHAEKANTNKECKTATDKME